MNAEKPTATQLALVSDDELAAEVNRRVGKGDGAIEAAFRKSSGRDADTGDWTQHGDGTGYPATDVEQRAAGEALGQAQQALVQAKDNAVNSPAGKAAISAKAAQVQADVDLAAAGKVAAAAPKTNKK
jgi:hypothetical protein